MRKNEILRTLGIKVRKTNFQDRLQAKTDYQRNSNYMIITSYGTEFYSKNGSLKDAIEAESLCRRNDDFVKREFTKRVK